MESHLEFEWTRTRLNVFAQSPARSRPAEFVGKGTAENPPDEENSSVIVSGIPRIVIPPQACLGGLLHAENGNALAGDRDMQHACVQMGGGISENSLQIMRAIEWRVSDGNLQCTRSGGIIVDDQ